MPILLAVDHEHHRVDAIAVGPVSYADAVNHLSTERNFQGLAYKELVDARGAGFLWSAAEIRQIVTILRRLSEESKLGPTAVIVSSDVSYGIIRMLGLLLEDVAEIRPFRDESEARAWLASK